MPRKPKPTPPLPPPPSTSPSGIPMPTTNLPGWTLKFSEDFTTNVPIGSFPDAVSAKWRAYNDGWPDTSRIGMHAPHKIISWHDSMMDINLKIENGQPLVAAPLPVAPLDRQLYGRYAVCFKADAVPGWATAWLLWPISETWPRDGEIDFPEGRLNAYINAFMHHQGATSGGDQDAFNSGKPYNVWHVAIIEWTPASVKFILDGVTIGTSTTRIPNTVMRYVLQTETAYGSVPTQSAHVYVDWLVLWSYTP